MNVMTIILWITILLIGVIAIILVKLHFQKDELEYDNSSIIPGMDNIQEKLSPMIILIHNISQIHKMPLI